MRGYRGEGDRREVVSSSLCRSAVEEVIKATALSQAAQGLKTGFHGQAFIDDKPHCF